jgi:flagellar basal-body rod modification protein FlgD
MTTVNTSYTAPQTNTPTPAAAPAMGEEFQTFIKLLTAQMRNQDPLAPLDSTQFVEQLATFSTLEQQVRSNAALESMTTMMNDMTGLLASQWLGQAVSIEVPRLPYTGSNVNFSIEPPAGTERSILTIKNADGQAVWTEELDPDSDVHDWDGRTQSGALATSGEVYDFSISHYGDSNELLGKTSPHVITTVTSISSENGVLIANTAAQLASELGKVKKIG